jgi:metallophosphoesterase superfamily enzyme
MKVRYNTIFREDEDSIDLPGMMDRKSFSLTAGKYSSTFFILILSWSRFMRQIKSAIVMSDLHLGRSSSYLCSDHSAFAANRKAILNLLQQVGAQDELILNGDIMELSLAGWKEIGRELAEFFKLLAEAGPYQRIVYIPGNHDHHFWRLLVERILLLPKVENKNTLPDLDEYPFCFVDQKFSSRDYDIMLNHFWPARSTMPEMVVKYPHHLLQVKGQQAADQIYLVSHGHFLEDLFIPMNILIEPARLDELEAFNNIWLEAFHYHLGQAGRLSNRVRALLDRYEKGGSQAYQVIKKVLDEIYVRINRKYRIVWPFNWMLKYAIKKIVKKVTLSRHSELFGVALNKDLKKNIRAYVTKYLLSRYKKTLKSDLHFPGETDIPSPFTFIFGHTHRPVAGQELTDAWIEIDRQIFPIANSGGWLRSDTTGKIKGQNAGIILINQEGWKWHSLIGQLK